MPIEISTRQVATDDDRGRVRAFFQAHIDDPTAFEIPARQTDRELGIPSRIRVAEDSAGNLVGAVFASNNPEDVIRWRMQGNDQVADVIAAEMFMIHELAVHPQAQRQGIGSRLVEAAFDDARGASTSVTALLYDHRTPGLTEFYRALGFQTLGPRQRLELNFTALPGITVGFPQERPEFAWALRTLNPARVTRL